MAYRYPDQGPDLSYSRPASVGAGLALFLHVVHGRRPPPQQPHMGALISGGIAAIGVMGFPIPAPVLGRQARHVREGNGVLLRGCPLC